MQTSQSRIQTGVKISRAALVLAKIAAWCWSPFAFIIGDPPANQMPAQEAGSEHAFAVRFSVGLGLWLLVILASLWHRRLRAKWTAENAKDMVAELTHGSGTLNAIDISASPFLHNNSWEADRKRTTDEILY